MMTSPTTPTASRSKALPTGSVGFVLVLAVIGFAILGSATFFAWLLGLLE